MKCPTLTFNVSVEFEDDPDLINAGTDATLFYFRGVARSKKHLTDGVVYREWLSKMAHGLASDGDSLARKLCASKLWVSHTRGFRVPRRVWIKWQTSASEVKERQEFERERKRRYRERVSRDCPSGTERPTDRDRDRDRDSKKESPQPPACAGGESPGASLADQAPPIPVELHTPAFLTAWDDWLAYRREHQWPRYRPTGLRQTWAKLIPLGPDHAASAIRESMANGWRGIFPEKSGAQGRNGTASLPRGIAARQAQEAREL